MKHIKHRLLILVFFSLISVQAFAVNQLANYLGTGAPRIHLELSIPNGPGWEPSFSIDYQQKGNIPWSTDSSNDWSVWNIKDEVGNYYGNIELTSTGTITTWKSYKAPVPATGYYLEGIHFSPISGTDDYQLSVDKIHGKTGPFPDAPAALPAVYPGTSTPIILSVTGANIVNNMGYPVVLKGMARPSLEWSALGQFLSPEDIYRMRQWGANAIRLNLNQNYWFSSGPVSQTGSYKQIINAIIYYATQHNMAVILDLHWVEIGQASPMANHQSIQFWKEVAAQYKDFGTVIFELFNEPVNRDAFGNPVGLTKEVWLNGNETYAGYQQLYDAVRSTGARNICIFNGLDWGYDLSFVNSSFGVKGDNIVYGAHPYVNRGRDDYQGPGGSFSHNFSGIAGKYPIIFTEFGDNQAADYSFQQYLEVYTRILGYINANNISYTGFAWWVAGDDPAFPALISDWNGTALNGGKLIKDDMQLHPGTPIYIN